MTARSPTMVTLHDAPLVKCRWWNDGLDCDNCRHLTVVGLHDTGPWYSRVSVKTDLALCACTVTGRDKKFDPQLLSQHGSTRSCLSCSVPEIH